MKRKEERMAKHCIYCKEKIQEQSVIDVCQRCGVGVWGEKMFKAIIEGMEKSREAGDLFQGSVNEAAMSVTLRKR